jgi:hypothetical protein
MDSDNPRVEFVGFHTTKEIKTAMQEKAKKYRLSLSAMLSSICEEWLQGIERVEAEKQAREAKFREKDVPLPFEE